MLAVLQGIAGAKQEYDGEQMPLEFLEGHRPVVEQISHDHVVECQYDEQHHQPSDTSTNDLIQCLHAIAECSPDLQSIIEDRLFQEVSMSLAGRRSAPG